MKDYKNEPKKDFEQILEELNQNPEAHWSGVKEVELNRKYVPIIEEKAKHDEYTRSIFEKVKYLVDSKAYYQLYGILCDYDKLVKERFDRNNKQLGMSTNLSSCKLPYWDTILAFGSEIAV